MLFQVLLLAFPLALAAQDVALDPRNAAGIRRLAVVSLIGDSIDGIADGLSTLQRRYLHATPEWGLDRTLERFAAERVAASGKFRGTTVEVLQVADVAAMSRRDRRRPIDPAKLTRYARDKGYDAVLAILPEESLDHPEAVAGVSIRQRQVVGGSISSACVALALRVMRTDDDAEIAHVTPAPCAVHASPIAWHASWDDYSPEQANATLQALRRHAVLTTGYALNQIGLRPRFRPGHRVGP